MNGLVSLGTQGFWVRRTKVSGIVVKVLARGPRKGLGQGGCLQDVGSNAQRLARNSIPFLDHFGPNQGGWIDGNCHHVFVLVVLLEVAGQGKGPLQNSQLALSVGFRLGQFARRCSSQQAARETGHIDGGLGGRGQIDNATSLGSHNGQQTFGQEVGSNGIDHQTLIHLQLFSNGYCIDGRLEDSGIVQEDVNMVVIFENGLGHRFDVLETMAGVGKLGAGSARL